MNLAKKTNRPFQEVLAYYGIERFLYRLGGSDFENKFVLKGALMLQVWSQDMARATRDIDFLGLMRNDLDEIARVLKLICQTRVDIDDGLIFAVDSIKVARIQERAGYEGVRASLIGYLGTAMIPIQVDIGFGDPVVPGPAKISYPSMLDMPAPKITGYPRESAIAEKVHAMVRFQILNSRMKDFYDLWLLAQVFDFEGEVLFSAIKRTFNVKDTDLDFDMAGLLKALKSDPGKGTQWEAFLQRIRVAVDPPEFPKVIAAINNFLVPLVTNFQQDGPANLRWKAPGPWIRKKS